MAGSQWDKRCCCVFLSARQYAQRSRGCIESLRPTINWFFLFIAKKTEIELMYLSIDCRSWHRSECHKTANRVNWIEEEISQLVLIARKNRHFCEIFKLPVTSRSSHLNVINGIKFLLPKLLPLVALAKIYETQENAATNKIRHRRFQWWLEK